MALIVSAGVSPGTAIISNPTEQTAVMASNFSMLRQPALTASIIPASSETGMKAPDKPPTWLHAIIPPFFTASFSIAKAAVVPWVPTCSRPISSNTWATESPTAGVGASERSTIPNGTPKRSEATVPTSCPIRVTLKAVSLMVLATTSSGCPLTFSRAVLTTPGPETPTLMTTSRSPTPWKAPAINGLSSTALQKITILALVITSFFEAATTTCPICLTASMLIPLLVEPTLTEAQTNSVSAKTWGKEAIKVWSPVW